MSATMDGGGGAGLSVPAAADLAGPVEAAVEDFSELAGLAAQLASIGERGSASEVLALACAALAEAVETAGIQLGGAPRLNVEAVPLHELAGAVGAEGLYRLVRSALSLALGDQGQRHVVESFLEAAGVRGAGELSDSELVGAVLRYLAESAAASLALLGGSG